MGKIALIVANTTDNNHALEYYIGQVEDLDALTDVLKEMTKAEYLNKRQSSGDIDTLVYAAEKAGADFSDASGKTASNYNDVVDALSRDADVTGEVNATIDYTDDERSIHILDARSTAAFDYETLDLMVDYLSYF
jgi:hypothetical protein